MSKTCDLELKMIVYDKILFEREGVKNKEELAVKFNVKIAENKDENIYKVSLGILGTKKDEYRIEIQITGLFSVYGNNLELIYKNAVAILMPFVRSQFSILTAQPGTDCVVLPPFNINDIMNKKNINEQNS